jgi:hypothetical protein
MRASIVVQPWQGDHAVSEPDEASGLMRRNLVLDGVEVECTGWFLEADEGNAFVKLHVRGVGEDDRPIFGTAEWRDKQAYEEGQPDMGYYVFLVTAFQMQLPDGRSYGWMDGTTPGIPPDYADSAE